jgi:hypoxanthine phosphoribosyltransferase
MKEYVTWEQFGNAIDAMVQEYKDRQHSCTCVYGIPRGGLPFAIMLSRILDIPFAQKLNLDFGRNDSILLVDDIADSGKTLGMFGGYFPNRIIFTMHYHKQSTIVPDFWVYEKTDKWIVYLWEEK